VTRIFSAVLLLPAFCLFFSCTSGSSVQETPLSRPPESTPSERPNGGGIADEIRELAESGLPSSLLRSLDLIRSRDLSASEFGRVMNGVNAALMRNIYPDMRVQLPPTDLPQTHPLARILREVDKRNYTPPLQGSGDYLQHVLPFLALFNETRGDRLQSALPDLVRAEEINPDSVLAPYFLGIVHERNGRFDEANSAYARAYTISRECYPAALGLARVMSRSGQQQEALSMLTDLVIRYPDNIAVKRQLALAYYQNGDWSRAEPAIAEILQRDSRDGEFILMRARVLVEQGQFLQAQAPLDVYASINPNNRLYLFLRARIQAEGYRNRDTALNYLRSLLRSSVPGGTAVSGGPADDEISAYAVRLLLESSRADDQNEGRELLRAMLDNPDPSLPVIDLALQDAIRRENWREAQPYLNRLLDSRRSSQDLLSAYTVERGQGNNARALSFARELYERDTAGEDGIITYISALIDTGRQNEAGRMIDSRLSSVSGGAVKSRYYYLRSRIRTSEDSILNDLRSSLFEDPRNLSALIAMFEVYHRRRDESRAVFYLKQAIAINPDHPQIRRYAAEYQGALGPAN
jgi:tetratricopeptide (TPR) repeat protein